MRSTLRTRGPVFILSTESAGNSTGFVVANREYNNVRNTFLSFNVINIPAIYKITEKVIYSVTEVVVTLLRGVECNFGQGSIQ